MRHYLTLGLLSCMLFACQDDPKGADNYQAEPLPNTPETVIQQYQAYMDSNRFERAALLSTPEGKDMLNMLAQIMAGDPPDSTIIHTQILDMNCTTVVDTARCQCELKDEYEAYQSLFKLVRIEGQWLVDVPEENDIEMTEEEWQDEQPPANNQ
ncbi:MAG: hypothetical protein KTR30_29245 [Saprospiraceae bacterium]|nr:hypothetical protein [Saprospiraceae bacterium]